MSAIILFLLLAGCQTIIATQDWEVNISAKINGTADQVWPFVADFCNLYKIYPNSVSFCDKGTTGQPGLLRYSITIARSTTDPNATVVVGWVREELLKIIPTKRYVGYEMHENTFGITKLKASMQVIPAGKMGSIFKWKIVAAPFPGVTYEGFLSGFETSLSGLVSLVESLI